MAVNVRIPSPLRRLTDGNDRVDVEGDTLDAVIHSLEAQFPGFRERLCDENGDIRHFVNIYVNSEDVRRLDGLSTVTKSGDEVSIVPAVAGG